MSLRMSGNRYPQVAIPRRRTTTSPVARARKDIGDYMALAVSAVRSRGHLNLESGFGVAVGTYGCPSLVCSIRLHYRYYTWEGRDGSATHSWPFHAATPLADTCGCGGARIGHQPIDDHIHGEHHLSGRRAERRRMPGNE
jgi:hypothetical protein